MKTYTIQHKYCKMTMTIEGYDVWHVMKSNNKDIKYWEVIKVENN